MSVAPSGISAHAQPGRAVCTGALRKISQTTGVPASVMPRNRL